jgi:trimeric autotransporter adhesin
LRNTNGTGNAVDGVFALQDNVGSFNTAVGWDALGNNTNGATNTAAGYGALQKNTTGRINTAVGYFAGMVSRPLTT